MLDRHKLILREIICNYYGTSLKELPELTEVSEKTLKNDISVIEGMLMEEGLPLNYRGDRIMIPFAEKKKYLDAYYDLTWRDYRDPLMEEQEDRKVGITIRLIRADDYLSMESIADAFHISKATVSGIIHDIEKTILHSDLKLQVEINTRKGILLSGPEGEKRKLLTRLFALRKNVRVINKYMAGFLDQDLIDMAPSLAVKVIPFLREKNLVLSDDQVYKMLAATLVAAQRIREGGRLAPEEVHDLTFFREYSLLLEHNGLSMPWEELSFMPIYNRAIKERKNEGKIVQEFFDAFNRKYETTLNDPEIINSVIADVGYLMRSGARMSDQHNYIFETMQRSFLASYCFIGDLMRRISQAGGPLPDEENRCYLAMYMQAIIQKQQNMQGRILLYNFDEADAEIMKSELLQYLGNKAVIRTVRLKWDLVSETANNHYDLVISSKSHPIDFNGVPFLRIHRIPTAEDRNKIEEVLRERYPVHLIEGTICDQTFLSDGVHLKLDGEMITLDTCRITLTDDHSIPMGVYHAMNGGDIYIVNFDGTDFGKYFHLINNLGRLLKKE